MAASAALLLACCAGPEAPLRPPAPGKLAVIGWDAATWTVLDPLLAEGRLPNLARLLAEGSRGRLIADPPIYSPLVWTTLATGFPPDQHGITDFQLADPRHPEKLILASTFHRRRAPLWQIASLQGRSVGFVGWWTSWPAEPVEGYLVSDHLAYNRWGDWAMRPDDASYHFTFPPELAGELRSQAVRPDSLRAETLTAIVPFGPKKQREMMEARGPVMFHGPSVFRFGYATDASNQAFARHLLASRPQPDLFSLTYILTDVAGHVFWHHYEPESFPGEVGEAALREAIPNVFEQIDRWTGELVELLDEQTTILVVSDHGMRASGKLPRARRASAADHDSYGIVVVSGPRAVRGADLGDVPALDFAPTLLALLDVPVARDMPGTARTAWLAEPRPVRWIDSYGDGRTFVPFPEDSPAGEAYRERLRALGYVQ